MAQTLTDTLTGTIKTSVQWKRVDSQELGEITQTKTIANQYDLVDGSASGAADLVFTDTRTIAAGQVEEIDLLSLTQATLYVDVPYTFRQLRVVRIVNKATVAGRRLLVGVDPGRPTVVYAAEVGPESEFLAVNQTDSWRVTTDNNVLRIANPSSAAISYDIYLLGTSVEAGGSGSGG